MYSAKVTIFSRHTGEVHSEHTLSGAKTPESAYMYASSLWSKIEQENLNDEDWPKGADYRITVYNNGEVVDKTEYADHFKIELFIDGESMGFLELH